MLDSTSRYYRLGTALYEEPDGRQVAYIPRRFLPQGADMPVLTEVSVVAGDRLDSITARTFGPPTYFWCICDANNALNPFTLTEQVGRTLRVPPPQFQGNR